jgi:HD-GYP domain-containing protein (c-di-GMP phosphodiesterase class II)
MNKQKIIEQLIDIGYSLTTEKNYDILMEGILGGAKNLTNSDGGTLYMKSDNGRKLSFEFVQTDSLDLKMGGTNGAIQWTPLTLIRDDGTQNREQVAAVCALDTKLINIPDVYEVDEYNFEGTKAFDSSTGYRSKSMLVVPMTNHEHEVIGVLQLLNKKDKDGNIISYTKDDEKLILSMSAQAAVSIANISLIENLENLLNAFIKAIGTAISEKSNYTGGHINRVATLSTLISDAINKDETTFKDVKFTKNELEELNTAAWLHDIGKIVTPEYIVDKATKLETIYDRINAIKLKFELLKKDKEIEYLRSLATANNVDQKEILYKQYLKELEFINSDMEFITQCNTGGEFMADDKIYRVKQIGSKKVFINNKQETLLSEDEISNLCIKKGTLNDEERQIINNHVTVTYHMLQKLPFPKKLQNVPLLAGSHHKAVRVDKDGKHGGYSAPEIIYEPMDIKQRILAIADVFEALTASDRPYKKANSLNQSVRILYFMAKDNDLDRDLVKFFVNSGLYLEYANKYLDPSQLDEVTVDFSDI